MILSPFHWVSRQDSGGYCNFLDDNDDNYDNDDDDEDNDDDDDDDNYDNDDDDCEKNNLCAEHVAKGCRCK